jgi:hypothetical protein
LILKLPLLLAFPLLNNLKFLFQLAPGVLNLFQTDLRLGGAFQRGQMALLALKLVPLNLLDFL